MRKIMWGSFAYGAIALLLVSCITPLNTSQTPSSSVDQVSTMVAATLQVLAPEIVATATAAPVVAETDLLPHSLYYLGKDDNWVNQVFRMERDGKTKSQLTSEAAGVDAYDVSPVDGSVAYITNNELIWIDANGANRRQLVIGGPKEGNNPWVTDPVFSPDGKVVAYSQDGLYLYELGTNTANLLIANQYGDTMPDGFRFPVELYYPVRYSPDGKKLLVALGHWELVPSNAVYDFERKELVKYQEMPEGSYCCSFHGGPAWAPDGSVYYGIASIHDTAYRYGELWRVDAATGAVTRMFDSPFAGSETVYLPMELHVAPDGQVYFFFGTYQVDSGYFDPPVLQLARLSPESGTDLTIVRTDNFRLMQDALWAPDASFVIVASAPEKRWDQGGGVLELYPTDEQREPVWLAPLGAQMKWGP